MFLRNWVYASILRNWVRTVGNGGGTAVAAAGMAGQPQ